MSRQFAIDLLRHLHDPVTPGNVSALMAWHQAEGGSARFNPFNTTQPAPGATAYNSVGVRNYKSYQQGLDATLATLENGRYGGILSALRRGSSPYAVAQAIGSSPWGTSGSLVSSVLSGWGGHAPGSSHLPTATAPAAGAGGRGPQAPTPQLGGGSAAYGNIAGILASVNSAPRLNSRMTLAKLFPTEQPVNDPVTPPQPLTPVDPRTPGGSLAAERQRLDALRKGLLQL